MVQLLTPGEEMVGIGGGALATGGGGEGIVTGGGKVICKGCVPLAAVRPAKKKKFSFVKIGRQDAINTIAATYQPRGTGRGKMQSSLLFNI
jgi:hypothetical protein